MHINFLALKVRLLYNLTFCCSDLASNFAKKVVKEETYLKDKKRSLISLRMCCMAWMYELLATLSAILSPALFKLGVSNLHYIDPLVMFLLIPIVHLMNDEDTKIIILEENWYAGVKHVFGMHTRKE